MRLNLKKSGPLIGASLLFLAAGFTLPAIAASNGDTGSAPSQSATPTAPATSTPSDTPSPGATDDTAADCASSVNWISLTDDNKESKYANGDAFTVDENASDDEQRQAVLDGIREYVYQDPAGASEIVTGSRSEMNWSALNNRLRTYVDSNDYWCADVASMLTTLQSADFSIEAVDAGMWSLYQVPTGDSDVKTDIRQGTTSEAGTAAVFRFDGHTLKLRLDCHFQPVRNSKFPDVAKVPGSSSPSPSPSAPSTSGGSGGSSSHPSPSPTPSPKKASQDPNSNGNAGPGGGTNTGNDAPSPAPSVPSDKRTNPPAPAASASPAPSASDGTNNGCIAVPGGPSC